MSTSSETDEQFMATVSHELRGPLHAILGLAEVLMESGLEADHLRLAEALYREASSMRVLVDDVVAFGQFRSATPSLTEAPFSPRSLVTSVVDRLRPKAEEAGLRLLVEFDADVPLRVLGDAVRFGQVVDNLVSNAIRYTEIGSVQVILAGDRETLSLQVRDSGRGMSPADLEQIFEPFVRVGNPNVRGTGLGLAVVQKIAEVMDGTITVDSAVGIGTTFLFTIPCRHVESSTDDNIELDGTTVGTVLVVEDSEINRTLATKQLELLGLSAIAVNSGEDALEHLASQSVDLILMDWNMPGMSGLETATAIRTDGLVPADVPIIAMTANVLAGDREACLAAGMNDHLGKPVSLDDMRRMMEVWLMTEDTDPVAEPSDSSVHEAIEQLVADLGDIDTVRIVVETYLGELAARRDALLDPSPEMSDAAQRAAHTLRSTSALLGANRLASLCLEFEQDDEPDALLRQRLRQEVDDVEALFTEIVEIGIAA